MVLMLKDKPHLTARMDRGAKFFGCELAILGGAMTWVSESALVAAISNAGAFGVLASGSMPPAALREEIQRTRQKTDKPFGVNLIVLHPQLPAMVEAALVEKIPYLVFAGGLPSATLIQQAKNAGTKVIAFAPALTLAKKLIRMGVDALIIEGHEAGGHVGQVSTVVLAQEILPEIRDIPVFVAGGIGRGESIASFLNMGAAGVQIGTAFVCTNECTAHLNFKRAFIKASSRDAVLSPQLDPRFPIIPVRGLANEGTKAFLTRQRDVITRFEKGELDQVSAQLEIEHFWAGALRRAVVDGDVTTGSVMAGQSIGLVKDIVPVHILLQRLCTEAESALAGAPVPA
jgi:enoyl-[acyl-carrier protein] reductase II